MFGHFSGLYKYAQDYSAIDVAFLHSFPSALTIFITESFWLRLFYILSGYLVSKSKIQTIKDLGRKVFLRFLRLALPLLGASFFILLLTSVFGVHNRDIQHIVSNQWMGGFFSKQLTFIDAFKEPFKVLLLGRCTFNSVWWVLKDMFFASLFVYVITYLKNLLSSTKSVLIPRGGIILFLLILLFIYLKKNIGNLQKLRKNSRSSREMV